ncbi:hypothetical protein V8E51_003738 [Hyaloscypha variabilis]
MGPVYDKVSSDDGSSTLGGEEDNHELFVKQQHLKVLLIANSVLFYVSALLLFTTYVRNTPRTAKFVEKYSSYSPAREAVHNETEEMWNWVTVDIGDQMITPEELKLVNKPEDSIKTKDPKTGNEGY